jgi:hypothetical protein
MSSTNAPHEGHAPDSPSDVRALPARPNLEFEHKQAKKLLAALRQSDTEALARIHAKLKHTRDTKPDEFKLSDAQFAIAREYGFTSWPRLVEYFEAMERQQRSGGRQGWSIERGSRKVCREPPVTASEQSALGDVLCVVRSAPVRA